MGTCRRGAATAYLPPDRAGALQLAAEIALAARSPAVEALLVGAGTALAILNQERQVIAVNAAYLALLGARDPVEVLGVRPGEALGCVHARAAPGGCGTAAACASCGGAAAILAASRGATAERDFAVSIAGPGGAVDRLLRVRAAPLDVDGLRLVAVALTDVTSERRRAALGRAFRHDLSTLASRLEAAAGAPAVPGGEAEARREDLRGLAARLVREVRLQRALADGAAPPPAEPVPVRARDVLRALAPLWAHHPAAAGKRLDAPLPPEDLALVTDPLLLEHVLANMVVNAFEATPAGGVVRLAVGRAPGGIAFRVWNAGDVPAAVRPRIFQRHFSTKSGEGRGEGTHAMRLFGEACLGGEVSFTTGGGAGTTFEVRLPLEPPRVPREGDPAGPRRSRAPAASPAGAPAAPARGP
jgi:signal transduction histidine kinase